MGRLVVSCFHCSRTIDWERRYNEQLGVWIRSLHVARGSGVGAGPDLQRLGMLGRFDASTRAVFI